jgi:hydrogenase nickel incorporation protein HypA/HybF
MHEVSIAESLLDIALRECTGKGFSEIRSITVRIGKASGIMPEALLFAFEAVRLDTAAHAATLTIEEVPVAGHCHVCETDFSVAEKYVFNCPNCGGTSFTVFSGRELDIREMEVF